MLEVEQYTPLSPKVKNFPHAPPSQIRLVKSSVRWGFGRNKIHYKIDYVNNKNYCFSPSQILIAFHWEAPGNRLGECTREMIVNGLISTKYLRNFRKVKLKSGYHCTMLKFDLLKFYATKIYFDVSHYESRWYNNSHCILQKETTYYVSILHYKYSTNVQCVVFFYLERSLIVRYASVLYW